MSYSVTGDGVGQTAVAALPHGCPVQMPNTPDIINSILLNMADDPFTHFTGNGSSLASEDSSGSTCSPVSPPDPVRSICSSLKIKKELKMVLESKQMRNAATAVVTTVAAAAATAGPCGSPADAVGGPIASAVNVAATASAGLAASSPGGGHAKKRRTDEESHGDGDDDYDDDDGDDVSSHGEGLTAEDEERRRRRRERNKIAATKCRLKKREKTTNLMQESNVLETKNYDLKSQIQELETQRNELMKMLSAHPCTKRHPHQHHQQQHQPQHHQQQHHHQQQQQQQQQHQHQHLQQYAVEPYASDPYRQRSHVVQAVDPPALKDAMYNGGGYPSVASVADQPVSGYHRPATVAAASVSTVVHYPIIGAGGGGNVYASCVDELYDYNKDLISGGSGGPPDLSHQYYDHGIC